MEGLQPLPPVTDEMLAAAHDPFLPSRVPLNDTQLEAVYLAMRAAEPADLEEALAYARTKWRAILDNAGCDVIADGKIVRITEDEAAVVVGVLDEIASASRSEQEGK